MNPDLLSLKLHIVDNNVWYMSADGPPVNTGLSTMNFLLQPMVQEAPRVRLIGMHRNIQLILPLFVRNTKAGRGIVEVCSPQVCRTMDERNNAISAFLGMRQYTRSSSTGGWHKFTNDDYVTYAIASSLLKFGLNDNVYKLFEAHPAWAPISFIPHLNVDACCQLFALILDPRWFIDPEHTSRGSKLRAFLGLTPNNMQSVLGNGSPGRHADRCKMVLDCWYTTGAEVVIDAPQNFLWRIFQMHNDKRDMTTGLLRASQAFVEYVRLTWLAALSRGHKQTEALFVPDYYFKLTNEVDEFYEHFIRLQKENRI